jgi:nucleoside phosphorylase
LIHLILVPQGAEHRAVCRGLQKVIHPPTVLSVPVGPAPLTHHLQQLHAARVLVTGQRVLMMGVCGGLVPELKVGDRVLYESCVSTAAGALPLICDRELTEYIRQSFSREIKGVQAVTSDRVVATPTEKQELNQQFKAEVVDMEGYAALALLQDWGMAVSMMRVVSDDSQHSIPDLSSAFDENGSLRPFALTRALIRQPAAGLQLIQGSLRGVNELQTLSRELFLQE